MKHKWHRNLASLPKVIDMAITECVKCGMIKQYVKGIPTYYDPKREMVFDRIAPQCNPLTP